MSKIRKLGQTDIEISAIGYGCMGQTHSYGVVEAEQDMVSLMQYAHETTVRGTGGRISIYSGKRELSITVT